MSTGVALGPIGQIARQVHDIDVAVEWYRDILELPHLLTVGQLAFFDSHGIRLLLSAEARNTENQGESVLYFRVNNIEASFRLLQSRGVSFRSAPHLVHRHQSGVEEWMAFFADPDGNTLALMSQVPQGAQSVKVD